MHVLDSKNNDGYHKAGTIIVVSLIVELIVFG